MLTDSQIENAICPEDKRTIDLCDGKGLMLRIQYNGTKIWRYRYNAKGKTFVLSLGFYPEISLQWARQLRDQAKNMRKAKLNPLIHHFGKIPPSSFEQKTLEYWDQWFKD